MLLSNLAPHLVMQTSPLANLPSKAVVPLPTPTAQEYVKFSPCVLCSFNLPSDLYNTTTPYMATSEFCTASKTVSFYDSPVTHLVCLWSIHPKSVKWLFLYTHSSIFKFMAVYRYPPFCLTVLVCFLSDLASVELNCVVLLLLFVMVTEHQSRS